MSRAEPLAVAVQMDPIHAIDIDGDSSFALSLEAQKRGYALYHYLPRDLSFRNGVATARAREMTLQRKKGDHFTLGDEQIVDLTEFDVILMRQDPPFDMSYITATHILEHVHPKTLVVNDPVNVRNAPEKLLVTHFPELMPPTLITSNRDDILAFRAEYQDIIVKPLYGNGGAGVFHLTPGDENLNSLLELFTELYREPIIAQAYLPEVRQGDKRVILIDGEAAAAINRVPPEGESRSNMHVGGRAEKAELTDRDREICEAIGPTLKEQGLIFVGIDVIGDYLTEINVTSPTGIQEVNRFDGGALEADIWDAIEARL
ncbi:MAG: glutathione synthase [Alphaproteobacteria bacterium]|nr:glutathione synthase [Alphaproteobacteria bacterium]